LYNSASFIFGEGKIHAIDLHVIKVYCMLPG
jgi:hypothetical protein